MVDGSCFMFRRSRLQSSVLKVTVDSKPIKRMEHWNLSW